MDENNKLYSSTKYKARSPQILQWNADNETDRSTYWQNKNEERRAGFPVIQLLMPRLPRDGTRQTVRCEGAASLSIRI